MIEQRRNALAFILAFLLPAAALMLRLSFGEAAGSRPTLIFFVIPITVCAYLGGLLPGLLSTAVSTLLSLFFLLETFKTTGIVTPFDLVQWSMFVLAGVVISYLAERLHLTQERTHANEARLAAMFDGAMDGIASLDNRLNIRFFNPAAEKMFGYKAAALLGSSALSLVPEQYRAAFERRFKAFADGGAPHQMIDSPAMGLRASGEAFPVEATVSRVTVQGEAHHTLVMRDISDRKRVEDALRESETLYRSLFQSLDEGVTLWDSDGRLEACNPAAERILGWPASTLVGMHYAEVPWRSRGPDQASFDPQTLAVAIIQRTGDPVLHRERKLTRPDGRELWIMQYGMPLPGGAPGQRPRVMITFVDITERRKSMEALSHMADIITHSEDAIISKSLDGVIQSWNPGAQKMLGYAAHEVIGHPFWSMVLAPDYRDAEREIRACIARGESAQSFEAVFVRKDGKPVDVSATASPLRDAGGKPVGVSVIARDITHHKAAEEALRERDAAEEASRLKSEFLATMSHELRTPLTGVIGFAEYLRAGQAGPVNAEQAECLDSVHNSSLHLLDLINSILDLSIIESGKMELVPETFSVSAVVAEACAVVSAMAEKKHIQLQQRVAPTLSSVTLDRTKFVQVLYNLASNAIKFTGDGGCVDVEVDATENRRLRIRVSDTGIGIAAGDIEKLFRMFHQLDGGDDRRQEGAGVGLALTKKIVELQRGVITVESAPGKGSVFTVTLPY